jgi:hypothetical protein
MPDLDFKIESAEAVTFAAAPLLAFQLSISNANRGELIQSIMLRCQIQIETTRRKYDPPEQEQLSDLFGEPDRWAQTLRPMLWTHTNTVVPPFHDQTTIALPVPCTFDFNVAATKYFSALNEGEVPLNLMFSGTVFYEAADNTLQAEQIPWDKEARFRLPVWVWKEMINLYYPNMTWLCVRRDVFDRLSRFKMQQGIPTYDQTLELLLPRATESTDDLLTFEESLPS